MAVDGRPDDRRDVLKNQLAIAVNQYQSLNRVFWTVFSIFAAAHAALLVGLAQIQNINGLEPLPKLVSSIVWSIVGVLAARAWALLLRRTVGHLEWHQKLVTRIENELGVPGTLQLFPARIADENPARDTRGLPATWGYFNTRTFEEDRCKGYGPPARLVMQRVTWGVFLVWVLGLVGFVVSAVLFLAANDLWRFVRAGVSPQVPTAPSQAAVAFQTWWWSNGPADWALVAVGLLTVSVAYMTLRPIRAQVTALREQLVADHVERLKDHKPVVFTEVIADDGGPAYQITNVGASPAVNTWYLDGETPRPLAISALAPGRSASLPRDLQEQLNRSGEHRHLLIAESRHEDRRWVVSINILPAPGGTVFHGFARPTRIDHKGSIQEFLRDEREVLLRQLRETPLIDA